MHSKEIKSVFHNSFSERKTLGPENINRVSSKYFLKEIISIIYTLFVENESMKNIFNLFH